MRTTLNIDTPVLEKLRRLQQRENKPLGQLASELIAESLARRNKKQRGRPAEFEWASQPMHARIDLEDKEAVYAALDEPRP